MAYRKPKTSGAKSRSLEEMTGVEWFESATTGRRWYVTVASLGEIHRFENALQGFLLKPGDLKRQIRFIQSTTYAIDPTFGQRLRMAAGMPCFSTRFIMKNFAHKEIELFTDKVIWANYDKSLKDFIEGLKKTVEKKTENPTSD